MSKKKPFVLRLNPEILESLEKWAVDEFRSTNGQIEWIVDRALREAGKLEVSESLDGAALYNLACLYLKEGDSARGLRTLRKSIERGYREIEIVSRDPDLDPLRGLPEFEELLHQLEITN